MNTTPFLIDNLVDNLKPVARVRPTTAVAVAIGATVVAGALVAAAYGLREDVIAGRPSLLVIVRAGILLLLGVAGLTAVIAAARPGVGHASHGWRWVVAGASIFPLATIAMAIIERRLPMADLTSSIIPGCLTLSIASGFLVGAALTLWLRNGAPTDTRRSGWLVGLASGGFGVAAYSLHCPSDSFGFVGIWYSLAVASCAMLGRLVVPRLLRW